MIELVLARRKIWKSAGFSLIETMLALAAGSVILLLSIGLLHQSMRLSTSAKARNEFHQVSSRLEIQFREDTRLAKSVVSIADTSIPLQFEHETRVDYEFLPEGIPRITRFLRDTDGKVHAQESYRLPEFAVARFSQDADTKQVILEVRTTIPGEPLPKRLEFRVAGVVGQNNAALTHEVPQ